MREKPIWILHDEREKARDHHRKPTPQPGLEIGAPDAPLFLTPEAKREWKRLMPELVRAAMITPLDGITLGLLCESLVTLRWASQVLHDEGRVLVNERSGALYLHPGVSIMEKALDEIRALAKALGLTPAARRRMGLAPTMPEKPNGDLD